MSLLRTLRNDFFGPTGNQYDNFSKDNKPTEARFRALFNSVAFIAETDDTADTGVQGLVKLTMDTDAKQRVETWTDGFSRAVTPWQLPTVETSIDAGATGVVPNDTKDNDVVTGSGIKIKTIAYTTAGGNIRRNYRVYTHVEKSLAFDTGTNAIKLVNDVLAPGNSYYYGTDSSGTKGYFLISELSDYKVKADSGATPGFLDAIVDGVNIQINGTDRLSLIAASIDDALISATAAIDWTKISKAGSSLADLSIRNYSDLTGVPADDDFNTLTAEVASDNNDYIVIYDATAAAYKKMLRSDFLTSLQTSFYTDNSVTFAKMQDFTGQGYIMLGGAAGAPTELDASTAGQLLIGSGTSLASVPVTGVININSSGVTTFNSEAFSRKLHSEYTDVNSTGASNKAYSYTMPAGTLANDGDSLQIQYYGTTAANANTKRMDINFGGTTVAVNGVTTNPNNLDWIFTVHVIRESATAQRAIAKLSFNGVSDEVVYSTPAETLSGTVAIDFFTDAAASDITVHGASIFYETS